MDFKNEQYYKLVEEEMKSEDELLDEDEELIDRAFKGGYEKCKSDIELNGFQIPDGYIFKDEYGNIINAQKIVLEKKKKEYPKTFVEVLDFWYPDRQLEDDYQRSYKKDLIKKFQDLLYARDAYWKIAGEEMGLGKPWEPDWNNISDKYCIYFVSGDAWLEKCQTRQCPFAFPTAEMRDAFYENFKELIEFCKEFL